MPITNVQRAAVHKLGNDSWPLGRVMWRQRYAPEICLLYRQGIGSNTLRKRYKVSDNTILTILRENGVHIRTANDYDLSEKQRVARAGNAAKMNAANAKARAT